MCTVLKSLFFHNDALPPKKEQGKLFCTKSVSESCEKWNMKNAFKITVVSAVTRPSTNHEEKKQKTKQNMFVNVS